MRRKRNSFTGREAGGEVAEEKVGQLDGERGKEEVLVLVAAQAQPIRFPRSVEGRRALKELQA